MPFIDVDGLSRFLDNTKTLIAESALPATWKYRYNADSDVLGMERDTESHVANVHSLPYNVAGELTNEENAYHDTANTNYAAMTTSATLKTVKIYLDTNLPSDAIVNSMTVSFKVGTSNISQQVWTNHSYTVKCGNTVLKSGDFALRTAGSIITSTVTNGANSPIICIEISAQTTVEQNVRLYGAQVDINYTTAKEYVSVVRQGNPAIAKHVHPQYATIDYVNSAIAAAIT